MPALPWPDGLRRVRPARIIRTESQRITEPIVFVLPDRGELVRSLIAYLGGRS